ncbi:MAG: hypothetical protein AAF228_06350 [Pseudomonadota bacterium]
MKFHFSIAVWGDAFIEVFTRIHLASLMAPGNLPAFLQHYPLEYRIYTTPEDAEKLENIKGYQNFAAKIPTKIITVDNLDFSDVHYSHRVFNELMVHAMEDAQKEGAYLMMNNPDTCWGDGSFRHIAELISKGRKCILNSAIRANSHTFSENVYNTYELDDEGALSISKRDLARLSWNYIHPYQRTTVWGQQHTSLMPSPIITEVPNEGYILNMAHLGSLVTISDHLNQNFETTTDGDYINRVFPNYDDIHVIESSDDVCVVELSDPDRYVANIVQDVPLNKQQIADYLHKNANWETHSLANFRRSLKYYWCDETKSLWDAVEQDVNQRTDDILTRIQLISVYEHLSHNEIYQHFADLLREFLKSSDDFPNVRHARKRIFLLPEISDLRNSLKSIVTDVKFSFVNFENFLHAIILDPSSEMSATTEQTLLSWGKRKFKLCFSKHSSEIKISSVNGIHVAQQIGLEDCTILILEKGFSPKFAIQEKIVTKRTKLKSALKQATDPVVQLTLSPVLKSILPPKQQDEPDVVSYRPARVFQAGLIQHALLNSMTVHRGVPSRARFLYNFLQNQEHGRKILYFGWNRLGSAGFTKTGFGVLAKALFLNKSKSINDRFLFQSAKFKNAVTVLQSEFPEYDFDEISLWDWGEVVKQMRLKILTSELDHTSFNKEIHPIAPTCTSIRDEHLNTFLIAAANAIGPDLEHLSRNSEIYYEMGLLLFSQKIYISAMACFAVCAHLSPGFSPALEMMANIERSFHSKDGMVEKLILEV